MPDQPSDPIAYSAEDTYGDEGYVWPYGSSPRRWDHTLNAYPPGPGRPKGTKRADLSGQVFEFLTVVERVEDRITPSGKTHPIYRCRCVCGTTVEAYGANLKDGKTKSCGCKAAGLRATWRKEEQGLQRKRVREEVEHYEAWKISDRRVDRDHQILREERQRNGLA